MTKFRKIISILFTALVLTTSLSLWDMPVRAEETSWSYECTKKTQTFIAPQTGLYSLKAYGGVGGIKEKFDYAYGSAGYAIGNIILKKGETLYITVGGCGAVSNGETVLGGYNGGGSTSGKGAGSGGGATVIAFENGSLPFLTDSQLVMVAGGSGGQSASSSGLSIAGSGGGENGGSTKNAMGGTQTSGYAKLYGEPGGTLIGGAGGGYWGGKKSSSVVSGSGGGSGYINTLKLQNVASGQMSSWSPNSNVSISYLGEVKTNVIVSAGSNGKIDGKEEVTYTGVVGTTINIPTPTVNESYIKFNGYKQTGGDGILNGTLYTFGCLDSYIDATYSGSNVTITAVQNNNTANVIVKAISASTQKITLQGSTDKSNWKDIALYLIGADDFLTNKRSTSYTAGTDKSYNVPLSGIYKVSLTGAGGGQDGGAKGGSGATMTFTAHFLTGDVLRFLTATPGTDSDGHNTWKSGGWGWSYGGAGGWSGGGGGSTGVYLNGKTLAVAAGGGGGNWSNGLGGRPSWNYAGNYNNNNNGEQGKGNWNLGGYSDEDSGGGGAGCPGGIRGTDSVYGGYGGKNEYNSSINPHLSITEQAGINGGGRTNGSSFIQPISFDVKIGNTNDEKGTTIDIIDAIAPDTPIKSSISTYSSTGCTASLQTTKDYGGKYYIRVPNYTDIKEFFYTSGFKGWQYAINLSENYKITSSDLFTNTSDLNIDRKYEGYYLHIATIDNAGNCSDTVTLNIPEGDIDNPQVTYTYQIHNDNLNAIEEIALDKKPQDGDLYTPGTWTSQSVLVTADVTDQFSDIQELQWNVHTDPSDITFTPSSGVIIPKSTKKDLIHRKGTLLCAPQKSLYGSYWGDLIAKDSAATFNGYGEDHTTISSFATNQSKILIDRTKPTASLIFHTEGLFTDDENTSEDFSLKEWSDLMAANYWTNQPVTITLSASDNESGLHSLFVSWDNGITWSTKTSIDINEMTSDICLIRDTVGNVTAIPYIIGNIDTKKPKEISTIDYPIPTNWVNKDINIDLISQDYDNTAPSQKASGIYTMTLYRADESFNEIEQVAKTSNSREGEPTSLELHYLNQIQGITYWVCDIYDKAGNETIINITNKLDKTAPQIIEPIENNIKVHQTTLDEFSETEVLNAINGDLLCYFNFNSSDYSKLENGELTLNNGIDSSGIEKVTLRLMNADNASQYVDFTAGDSTTGLPGITLGYTPDTIIPTNEPNDPPNFTKGNLVIQLSAALNTYERFPDWAAMCWKVTIWDRAGNQSETYGNVDGEEIKNFSIKTVIHSDEDKAFDIKETSGLNKGNTTAYFRTGDLGYTETWTVGYVPEIKTDFGSVGTEMSNEIIASKVLKKYNIGDNSVEFQRLYKSSIAGQIIDSGRPNKNGIPYATYYNKLGYWNSITKYSDGTQIRIPPYYKLHKASTKREDGRDNYQWETHFYNAIAKKNGWTEKSQGMYIIWDTKTDEVHYRVTHES